jgi:mannose-6-phosphate isomerase-like protein (cupin superfamily)
LGDAELLGDEHDADSVVDQIAVALRRKVRPRIRQPLEDLETSIAGKCLKNEFHWHHHDDTDEFFLVLDGQLLIDLEGGDTITLDPHQGFTVPRGVVHRTRAPLRTSILMIEAASVKPTGD